MNISPSIYKFMILIYNNYNYFAIFIFFNLKIFFNFMAISDINNKYNILLKVTKLLKIY